MVGKGSINHNTRSFHAANTDPVRSHLNRSYCNEDIKQVYHNLFDDAVERYNEKQTRSDRCIENYYEKIRSGKQEKLFHEIILQIGNKDDMNTQTENGELAAKVLDEYMKNFQYRNPNMRVFSAHLHMDEATPHLHIDFVPFTEGSKRGLDIRVSLKQALAAQGFSGGTRQETEWNQWVSSEKEQLAEVMQLHGIEWKQMGTHEKHLSVYDFEKKKRTEEVAQLEAQVEKIKVDEQESKKSADKVQKRLDKLNLREKGIKLNMDKYDNDPEWKLPEPKLLMYAQAYKTKIVEPFIKKLKDVIRSVIAQWLQAMETVKDLKSKLSDAYADIDKLTEGIQAAQAHNSELKEYVKDYIYVRKALGDERTNNILYRAKAEEQALQQKAETQTKAAKAAARTLRRPVHFKSYDAR
jgi:hypothetical protein